MLNGVDHRLCVRSLQMQSTIRTSLEPSTPSTTTLKPTTLKIMPTTTTTTTTAAMTTITSSSTTTTTTTAATSKSVTMVVPFATVPSTTSAMMEPPQVFEPLDMAVSLTSVDDEYHDDDGSIDDESLNMMNGKNDGNVEVVKQNTQLTSSCNNKSVTVGNGRFTRANMFMACVATATFTILTIFFCYCANRIGASWLRSHRRRLLAKQAAGAVGGGGGGKMCSICYNDHIGDDGLVDTNVDNNNVMQIAPNYTTDAAEFPMCSNQQQPQQTTPLLAHNPGSGSAGDLFTMTNDTTIAAHHHHHHPQLQHQHHRPHPATPARSKRTPRTASNS